MADLEKREQLAAVLSEIRESLQADGADLDVLGLEGSTARVRLLVGPSTCQECIMPKDFLQDIMLMRLQEEVPGVSRVELDDPR